MAAPVRPRNWEEARQQTLDLWAELRESIAGHDEVELLTGIHAACGLCSLSQEEKEAARAAGQAGEGVTKCHFCPFYEQFGGCRDLNREMTDRLLEKDWEGLERSVDRFIELARRLEMPWDWLPADEL